jgi:hypothetical protein
MIRRISLVVAGLASLWAISLRAQEAVLGEMYGNGVHAYFAEDYYKAYQYFSAAINAGSKDPRCFYFRGLTYLGLGRPEQAEGDFQQGAKLETNDVNRSFSVAKSLERVQGPARTSVERYRVGARLAAIQQSETERKKYYDEINRQQREMMLKQTERTLGEGVEPAKGKDDAFGVPGKTDAKAKPDEGTDEPPEKTPAKEKDDVFSKPAAPVDKTGGDDIFSAPPAKAKPPKPADDLPLPGKEKPAKPDDDLLNPPGKEKPPIPDGVDPGVPSKPPAKADSKLENPFGEEPVPEKTEKTAVPTKPDAGTIPGPKPAGGFLGALGGAVGKAVTGTPSKPGEGAPVPGKVEPGFDPPKPGPGPGEKPAGGIAPPPAGQPVPVPGAPKAAPDKDLFEN